VREMIAGYLEQLEAGPRMSASTAGGATPATAAAAAITAPVRVTLSDKIAGKALPASARLFVMARSPGQPGPPLAVQLLDPRFPQDVDLRSTDSVMGGGGFKAGQEIEIEARISLNGGADSRSGDPFGTVRVKAGAGSRASLEISQLKP
jgi:hypothetical protein